MRLSEEQHLRKAALNRRFFTACQQSEEVQIDQNYADWFVIVRLYECLHLVGAIAARATVHFRNHEERNRMLYQLTNQFDKQFAQHYNDLYNLSWRARYTKASLTQDDLEDAERAYAYIRTYAIRKHGLDLPT